MKRLLPTLAFMGLVLLLFVAAYLSWVHRGEPERMTEEARHAQMMEEAAKGQAEKMGR